MEERLDDALNVLRNHCEPQVGGVQLTSLESSFVSSPNVPSGQLNVHDNCISDLANSVKLERVPPSANATSL